MKDGELFLKESQFNELISSSNFEGGGEGPSIDVEENGQTRIKIKENQTSNSGAQTRLVSSKSDADEEISMRK